MSPNIVSAVIVSAAIEYLEALGVDPDDYTDALVDEAMEVAIDATLATAPFVEFEAV